ncbi:MAG: hypothetical protein Q9175_005793 [Cornicularia normoerica]
MSTPQNGSVAPIPNGNVENSEKGGLPPRVRLDVSKLHSLPSEQQDLYLFTFTVELESYATSLEYEVLCTQQTELTRETLQIINLSSPIPSKAVRNNLGRCYATIFGKSNRKTLFESVNQLVAVANAGKGEKELHSKHAAVHCLGELYKAAGDSAINLSSLACSSLLRLLKSAQNHAGLRAAIFQALGKVVGMIQGSIEDSIARDVWKAGRAAASGDKAALVQTRACQCLQKLISCTDYFETAGDFENLKAAIWKACETSTPAARHAAASCLASALVKSYSDDVPSKSSLKVKKSKKLNKNQAVLEEADEEITRPGSPSGKKTTMKLELSLSDMFRQLSSQYHRSTTSNRLRAGIAHCYIKVLGGLKPSIVETNYGRIMNHLMAELLSNASVTHDRYRLLLTRSYVQKILADCIGSRILGETGRLNAARSLINDVLKNYPQALKEVPEPSKHALVGVLDALASLIQLSGAAFISLGDSCREALVQVLQHPSYTVQIHASHCLRAFVMACPQQLLSCASICMNSVTRELNVLTTGRQSPRRCVGYANGLAAVLSISPSQPLYSSLEISSRVLSTAIDLLKSSSKAELRVAGTQVQVAWILIGGLMALGPNFVKIHLSQFLLLWRNALPKPLTRENTAQRQSSEITYLTHVRECTLGSILSFLEFNRRLITNDVAKRIATMLQNTVEYLENLPRKTIIDDAFQKNFSSLQLQDLVLMVRRRVLQCYSRLISFSPQASGEILTQSNLLTLAATLLADPESYAPGTLGSSIANAAGTFESIWEIADNSGFGITGLVRGPLIKSLPGEHATAQHAGRRFYGDDFFDIDEALMGPICGAQEHDSVYLYTCSEDQVESLPDPPATEVVNSAIVLFATAFPLHSSKVQEGVLEQLATFLASMSLQRDPGRKAAVAVNTAMALLSALKVAVGETIAEHGDLKHPTVEKTIEEILRGLVIDQDRSIRSVAYEAIGRLCNSSGNSFTANEVNTLIDMIVSNRDPNARAGCAMALGSIHAQVGGMAAGFHLKKIHGVLMSLCSDPNPTVHFCAIEALSQVADSAGLTFSGYVSSTLGLLGQIWTCDTHNEEAALTASSNLEFAWPTATVIAHSIDSLVNVLGPDLQDMTKARELMLVLMKQFAKDDLAIVRAECLRTWEHMYLYDPGHVDLTAYVHRLQENLESANNIVRKVTVDGLYNLMRRDAEYTLAIANEGLEDQLWLALNDSPEEEGIRNLVQSWLGQSSLTEAEKWVSRCQHVFTKAAKSQPEPAPATEPKSAAPDLQDEEVAGFALGDGKDQNGAPVPETTQELLRWQTRAFALQCLSDLAAMIGKDMESDPGSAAGHALQNKIAEVIRLAFLASTASVVELQVGGLQLIDQVLKIFGTMPDPDFSEALLLEQYQAQVSSALTPAFGVDSSPDLASAAVDVCATFIAAGLVTDVDRMGRILKLLVTALESFTDDALDFAIGELRGLSPNAQIMVRMAVLSAWAELQVASTEHEYLVKVMQPHVAKLTPLWLSSLQEFARLRFEPDISNSMGPARPDEGPDVVYAALNRQTLLKFYQDSWLKLVDAIASLIDQDSDFVFDALDGKSSTPKANGTVTTKHDIDYRDEPAAFFFVLFGIVIEALTTRPGSGSEAQTLEVLLALKRILQPSVSGNAVFQDSVFAETMELFDRLALTEALDVQLVIVGIARNMCLTHPSARVEDNNGEHLSDDIEQLFELTRIIVLVLAGILPNLAERIPSVRPHLPDEAVSVIQTSLEALVDASEIFPSIIKTDLHASILHIFGTILSTGACQANVVPQAFPIFKRFLQTIATASTSAASSNLIRGCLHRFLSVLSHAQRRESETSLPCAKNTLLACTILLTNASRSLAPNDPLIISTLDEMLGCLQDLGLAKVVASCLRSLLVVSPKSETDESIARYLFPHLLRFVADTELPDPENARSLTAHALTSFVRITSGDASSAAMCIIIPMLLNRASAEGKAVYLETSKRLLELAGGNLTPMFMGVVAKMSAGQRTFMETVIREGAGAGRSTGGNRESVGETEPSIALKLNFGGR